MNDKNKEIRNQALKQKVELIQRNTRTIKNTTNGRVSNTKLKWDDVYQCWAVGVPLSRNMDRQPRKMTKECRIRFQDAINHNVIHPFQAWCVINYSSYRGDVAGVTHDGLIWDELTWTFSADPEKRYEDTDMELGPLLFWLTSRWIYEKIDYEFKNDKRVGHNTGKSVQTNRMMFLFKTRPSEEGVNPKLVMVPWVILRQITFSIINKEMSTSIFQLMKTIKEEFEPIIYNDMVRLNLDELIENNIVAPDIIEILSEEDDSFVRLMKHYGDKNVRPLDLSSYPEGSIERTNEVLVVSHEGVSLTVLGCGNFKGKPKPHKLYSIDKGEVMNNESNIFIGRVLKNGGKEKSAQANANDDDKEEGGGAAEDECEEETRNKQKKRKILSPGNPKDTKRFRSIHSDTTNYDVDEEDTPVPKKKETPQSTRAACRRRRRRPINKKKEEEKGVVVQEAFNRVTNDLPQVPFFFNSFGQGLLELIHPNINFISSYCYGNNANVPSPSVVSIPPFDTNMFFQDEESPSSSPSSRESEELIMMSMEDMAREIDHRTVSNLENILGIPMLNQIETNPYAIQVREEMRTTVDSIDPNTLIYHNSHAVSEDEEEVSVDFFDQDSEIDEECEFIEYNTTKDLVLFSQEQENDEEVEEGETEVMEEGKVEDKPELSKRILERCEKLGLIYALQSKAVETV